MRVLATAYGPPWDAMEGSGVTSTGIRLRPGHRLPIIAVDPSVIPYGSIVRVDNSPYGRNRLFVAGDTGGAFHGGAMHIDFFVPEGRSAQNGWGARNINLTVVKRGNGPGSVQSALNQVLSGQGLPSTVNIAQQRMASNTQPSVSTSFSGGQPDQQSAALASLMAGADRKINTSGKVTPDKILGRTLANLASGQFTTPSQANTSFTDKQQQSLGNFHAGLGGGDVNPLGPGWSLGRTDMGVDANAAPGAPIHAINDSVVAQILPNWFKGQPLVLMRITSGPNAGKYWYVAEQISHGLRVGQHVSRGQVIARYASHGTGIEIGWGSPSTGSRTLAGPHYTEGAVTREGADFRHRILHA